jgi:hypothetical protein
MDSIRLPRFKRSPNASPIRLTERDHEVLRHVHRHRFLRSDHLRSLLPGSHQQLLRRLQKLFHHGYLDRPRAQLSYYHAGGSNPYCYGLGSKGAKLLAELSGGTRPRLERTNVNQCVRQHYLKHTLLIAEVMVAIETACACNRTIRFLPQDELASRINLRDPFRWTVNVHSRRLGVRPDNVFGLENAHTGERSFYFLEADRTTMPVTRRNLRQSSYFRKLLAYEATWKQDIHRTRFGFHRFRVLTVTTSAARVKHLIEVCRQLEHGQGLFLYTAAASFRPQADSLSVAWETAKPPFAAAFLL